MTARAVLSNSLVQSMAGDANVRYQLSDSTSPTANTPNDEMVLSRIEQRLREDQSPIASGAREKATGGATSPSPLSSSVGGGSGGFSASAAPPGELRVAILGFNGVGKTAFIVRFLTRRFIGEYCRGIEAKYKCSMSVDDEIINLSILDSSLPTMIGSESDLTKANSVGNALVRIGEGIAQWADAFILVYSITSHRSFQVVREIRKQINEYYPSPDKISNKPVIMLLGNKSDLEHFREVDAHSAEAYVESKNDLAFYELSTANSPDDVQRCMYAFIRLARVRLLTSVAAASIVQQSAVFSSQQEAAASAVAVADAVEQAKQQAKSQSKHHRTSSESSNEKAKSHHRHNNQQQQQQQQQQGSGELPPAVTGSGGGGGSGGSSTADSAGKQSAKAFLLNKMFGGMMKQARQVGNQSSSRRSADANSSGSGNIYQTPSAPTFSD